MAMERLAPVNTRFPLICTSFISHSGRGGGGHGKSGGADGITNQVEKATNMDLNGDGRIGGGHGQPHAKKSGGAGGGGLMNQLEKATHMDLNGDGRVGGGAGGARSHH